MQPPASLKALNDPIYEAFYGLTEQPFAITTDPRFFYLSGSHQRAYTELLNGLRRREGLLMLTGETGIGKTTLCRAVLDALGDRTFSAIILNPYMTGAEVLRIVLRDFGLVSHEELRRGGLATADIPQLLDTLEGFLQSLVPLGSHAVIVLDEAQALTPAVLDQIRLLTGLEYQGKRLVQVVLCGQPALLQTIKADSLLSLNERITRRVELMVLGVDDIRGYIEHRLGVAGGAHSVHFDPAATQAIAELSRGLPRRVNVLCDRALQEGRIEGVSVITADLVKRAARAVAGVHAPLPVLPLETVRPVSAHVVPPTPLPPVVAPREPALPAADPAPAVAAPAGRLDTPVPPVPPDAVRAAPRADEPALDRPAAVPSVSTPPVVAPPPASTPAPVATDDVTVITARPAFVPPTARSEAERHDMAPAAVASHPPLAVAARADIAEAVLAPAWPAATADIANSSDDSSTSEFLPEAAIVSRELSFGQEKAPERRTGRLVAAAAALVILGGVGYAAWGWDVQDVAATVPAPPAAPAVVGRAAVPTARPITSREELQLLYPVRRFVPMPPPDPVVDTPPEAAFPSTEPASDPQVSFR